MKFQTLFTLFSIIAAVKADLYEQGDNYSTFTPTDGILSGATTDFTQSFGIAINPIVSSVVLSSVTTEENGEVVVTQIGDGQIQAATSTNHIVVTQIGDGQIQAGTATTTSTTASSSYISIPVVTQIGDGQIQATTLTTITTSSTSVDSLSPSSSSEEVVIVTTKVTKVTKKYVTVGYTPSSSSSSFSSSSSESSSDDVTTTYTVTPTTTVYSTLTSANLPTLAPTTVIVDKRAPFASVEKRDLPETCYADGDLSMTLTDSILYDSQGRIGSIVANYQFQFDGPTPQNGAIYTAGWSIYDGKLALGQSTTFYQCLSGDFYNLYEISIGEQCTAVELEIVVYGEC